MTVLTLLKIAGDVVIRGMGKLTPRIEDSYDYWPLNNYHCSDNDGDYCDDC